jgi:hypothetical protein
MCAIERQFMGLDVEPRDAAACRNFCRASA